MPHPSAEPVGRESETDPLPVIGLIPAAGRAERLGALPCSKEILPLGLTAGLGNRPRVLCSHLLEALREGGVERALILLRQGKWDIPAFLGADAGIGLELVYRVIEATGSVPETLARACPFLHRQRVALGFPDILFEPRDAFARVLERQRQGGAPIVLGLFPTDQGWKADMVERDEDGRVRRLVIKQPHGTLRFTWSIAVWGPSFSRFLRDWVAGRPATERESYVGDVIQAAIDQGWHVDSLAFEDGRSHDAGTPEDLRRAIAEASAG